MGAKESVEDSIAEEQRLMEMGKGDEIGSKTVAKTNSLQDVFFSHSGVICLILISLLTASLVGNIYLCRRDGLQGSVVEHFEEDTPSELLQEELDIVAIEPFKYGPDEDEEEEESESPDLPSEDVPVPEGSTVQDTTTEPTTVVYSNPESTTVVSSNPDPPTVVPSISEPTTVVSSNPEPTTTTTTTTTGPATAEPASGSKLVTASKHTIKPSSTGLTTVGFPTSGSTKSGSKKKKVTIKTAFNFLKSLNDAKAKGKFPSWKKVLASSTKQQ
eukprot:432330_1